MRQIIINCRSSFSVGLIIFILITSFALFAQQFIIPIDVTDGMYGLTLRIGVDPNGSNGYDPGLDQFAPPPPPSGAFDARLSWNNEDYFTDIRDNSMTMKTFIMTYSPSSGNGPIVLRWDSSTLGQLGVFEVIDNITGTLFDTLDMTSIDSLIIDSPVLQAGIRILVTPGPPVSVKDTPPINTINEIMLYPNYPNPFNGSTKISYYLQRYSKVNLSIYNHIGQKLETLKSDYQGPGLYTVSWDGTLKGGGAAASGVYYGVLSTAGVRQVIKMVLMK